MSNRPKRTTDEEFAAHLGVEKTDINTVSSWQKKDRVKKRLVKGPAQSRSPKQPQVVRKEASELLCGKKVFFSTHAIGRFIERARKCNPPLEIGDNPEEKARELLAKSKEDQSVDDVDRVKGLINNRFVDVIYLSNAGLRFILKPKDNSFVVLTIESIE